MARGGHAPSRWQFSDVPPLSYLTLFCFICVLTIGILSASGRHLEGHPTTPGNVLIKLLTISTLSSGMVLVALVARSSGATFAD